VQAHSRTPRNQLASVDGSASRSVWVASASRQPDDSQPSPNAPKPVPKHDLPGVRRLAGAPDQCPLPRWQPRRRQATTRQIRWCHAHPPIRQATIRFTCTAGRSSSQPKPRSCHIARPTRSAAPARELSELRDKSHRAGGRSVFAPARHCGNSRPGRRRGREDGDSREKTGTV
jgi:hypothetical protein